MSRTRQFGLLALFIAAFAGTGGWIYYQQHRFKHFAVHEPGMVYRSAWLAPDVLTQLVETYQFRSVVNLCNPEEGSAQAWEAERRAVEGSGAKFYAVPLPNSVQVDPQAWSPHFDIMANPDNYPMLVHCQHGVTRTGMFLTAYDVIYRHKSAGESLKMQPDFGHYQADVHLQSFGKNFEQFLRENPTKFASNPLETLR